MKVNTGTKFINGSKYKHLPNRNMTLFVDDDGVIHIITRRADVDAETLMLLKESKRSRLLKGRVIQNALYLTGDSAYILKEMLDDYFERVEPNMKKDEGEKTKTNE